MKAWVATGYGPVDTFRLADIPLPEPGPGQVQVRVEAVSLNPADQLMTSGSVRDVVPLTFPYVLGTDFAGTVSKLGHGVDSYSVGDAVFGFGAPDSYCAAYGISAATSGALADYAVFDVGPFVARRPAGLDVDVAASLPSVGMTGMAVVAAGDFGAGSKVLVVGAAGGIGSIVVPLLAERGVDVLATARGEDLEYVRNRGARYAMDYTTTDIVAETLRQHPTGVDGLVSLALDGDGLIEASRAVAPGGRLLSTTPGMPPQWSFPSHGVSIAVVMGAPTLAEGTYDELAALVTSGRLPTPAIQSVAFDEVPQAYRRLASGLVTRGKIVVTMPRSDWSSRQRDAG